MFQLPTLIHPNKTKIKNVKGEFVFNYVVYLHEENIDLIINRKFYAPIYFKPAGGGSWEDWANHGNMAVDREVCPQGRDFDRR